ncbi:sigma-70 family RNA polymerase sigma factor [Candidatus Poribacteria bacterium]|nr:sigma-70 family RNA polymerase sigma factor [Candidatus Poribacteria bacterium]
MKISDEILVQRVLDGDKSSFGILVERYKRSVFQHAIKTTRDFHEAEDITQDVFLKAYLNLQKLREPAKFGGWLRGITQNLCRKWIHKKRMLSDLEIPLDNLQTEVLNQWLKEQDNSESWEFGTEVANNLSDEQKDLLKLFYIDNRSCRDVAQQMGATEVAIRQRLSRTRQQLKNDLLEGERNMNRMIAISAIYAFLLGGTSSVSGGTWKDDFSDGNLEGYEETWGGARGIWTVEDGQLVIDKNDAWATHQILAGVVVDDVTMEFDTQMEQIFQNIHSIELCLRWQSDNAVLFTIGRWNNQWLVAIGTLVWEGRFENWHEMHFPFEVGQWHHLKGVAQGNEFTFFIDGEKVIRFNQERLVKGKVGFGAGGCKVRFDNLVITGPNVPDAGPSGLAVESAGKLTNTWGRIKQVD